MKVNFGTYRDYNYRERDSFSYRERELIGSLFIYNFNGTYTECVIVLIDDSNRRNHYILRKMVDEYYTAHHDGYNSYYLLDQYDEFKEFLENLKNSYVI